MVIYQIEGVINKNENQYADKHRSGATSLLMNLNLLKTMIEMPKSLRKR